MSKFFKALEQAKHDRALRAAVPAAPVRLVETPEDAEPPRGVPRVDYHRPAAPIAQPSAETPNGPDEHLVSLLTPAAFEAEQYRALRHSIEHLHRTSGLKVIAVSSPGMGDGKTLTALNLTGALAQAPEARVLLIDADLRRPAVGHLLGLGATGEGLVDAILDPNLTVDRISEPQPQFNFSVIRAGLAPLSPYEVLKSPRLGDLLDHARHHYDFVVIDTPPLTTVQDCRLIARWVDGFLVVVSAHRTPQRLLEESLTVLDEAKILGIVFNQDDRSMSRHYGRRYQTYYSGGAPSLKDDSSGALRRAVTKVTESLRGRRNAFAPIKAAGSRGTSS